MTINQLTLPWAKWGLLAIGCQRRVDGSWTSGTNGTRHLMVIRTFSLCLLSLLSFECWLLFFPLTSFLHVAANMGPAAPGPPFNSCAAWAIQKLERQQWVANLKFSWTQTGSVPPPQHVSSIAREAETLSEKWLLPSPMVMMWMGMQVQVETDRENLGTGHMGKYAV